MWVFQPGTDGRTRLSADPTLATRVVIDRRGSSTINNAKYNLNVEARKSRDDDDKQHGKSECDDAIGTSFRDPQRKGESDEGNAEQQVALEEALGARVGADDGRDADESNEKRQSERREGRPGV